MRKLRGPALIELVESILLLSFRFPVDELVVGLTLMECLAFQVDGPSITPLSYTGSYCSPVWRFGGVRDGFVVVEVEGFGEVLGFGKEDLDADVELEHGVGDVQSRVAEEVAEGCGQTT
jgi:hypothetical protein